MTYLLYNSAKQNILVNASKANVNIVQQISEKIEIVNQNIISVSNLYFLNEDVRTLLKNDWTDQYYEEILTRRSIQKTMETMNSNFMHMQHSTVLFGFNGIYYTSNNSADRRNDEVRIQTTLEAVEREKEKLVWTNTYSFTGKYIFSAFRYIRDMYTGTPLGLLILDFDEQILFDMYRNMKDKNIFILSDQGIVLSNKDKHLLSADYSGNPFFQKIRDYQSGYFISRDLLNEQSMISFFEVPNMGWYVVDVTPLSDLLKSIQKIKAYYFLMSMIILSIIILVSYVLANLISARIKKLVASMSEAGIGGHLNRLMHEPGKDEIGVLVFRYNLMIDKINQLMKETVEQQEKKRKAEIQALQAQINPHFLYNTLNSIRWMAKSNRPQMVDRMIIALVQLLRQTISTKDEFILMKEEIQFLKNYVTIQKVRYGNKFNVHFDISPDVLHSKIMKLLLQPILENSIFHGIEPKDSDGIISVKGYHSGEHMIIEITDDGVGMNCPEETVESGTVLDHYRKTESFGLYSIEQRIRMHFGNKYGLKIHSEKNKGTMVTVILPLMIDERKEEGSGDAQDTDS
jgi:two-component system sensor histidine kinase YesM